MELGGVVTVDYIGDMDHMEDIEAEVGTVELSAIVPVSSNIQASVTLISEGDLSQIGIDAAIVEWQIENSPATILFGQQDLGHGLMSTHLISDPLIEELSSGFEGPSIGLNLETGIFSPFLGVAIFPGETTTEFTGELDPGTGEINISEVENKSKSHYRGLAGVQIQPTETLILRTSTSVGSQFQDAVLGGELALERLTFDLEGYHQFSEGDDAIAGLYAGIAIPIIDLLSVAVRYDVVTENNFDQYDSRIGGGLTLNFEHGVYIAMEYGQTIPSVGENDHEIGIQMGLESSLKLPGFQRKTLIQNAP